MENICRLCFQPAALFQVPGYNLPTCVKCSEHLTTNGLSSNFYQNIRQDLAGQQQQPQPMQDHSTIPPSVTNQSVLQQQQNAPPQQQHSQPSDNASEQQNSTGGNQSQNQSSFKVTGNQQVNSSADQNSNKKQPAMSAFDLEKTLQNIDVDLLFNEEGTCPLCSKTFSRKTSLLTHIRNHSAERKFVCTFCQKGFTQAANLRNHERIHTNDRPYVCVDCGKAFTQITNLNNHRRLHTGERPFVCIEPECGRSFAQVTNLNNHMKTHHKVQQYCCNQCPKKFTQVTSLNAHLQAHAGITGYYCPRCPEKTFKQQSQLHTHMKSHGLAYPYECQKCDEKFLQQNHLDQHNKMHDEFKFKCDMCPSSFNQESLLKKHMQRHIEGRYLTCPVASCNQGFTIKQQLSKHLLTRHSHNEIPLSKRSKKAQTKASQVMTVLPNSSYGGKGMKKNNLMNNTIDNMKAGLQQQGNDGNDASVQQRRNTTNHIVRDNVQQQDEELKCNDCSVHFSNENDLREHIFYKHPERRFMQAIIEENKYLMRMQNQQHFVCNLCCNVFKSHLALVRHTAKFHGQLL